MITREEFDRYLSQALANLFDFVQLEHNPLCSYLPEEEHAGMSSRGRALQRAVLRDIEALKPDSSVAPSALPWRTYNLLRMRYIEGRFVKEIMNYLQLGDRQLRRENQRAIAALASILWDEWQITAHDLPADHQPEVTPRRFSITPAIINLPETFDSILNTLQSMFGSNWQNVHLCLPPDLPPIHSDRVLLRQAFITAFHGYLSDQKENQVTVTGQLAGAVLRLVIQTTRDTPPWTKEEFHYLQGLFLQMNNILQVDPRRVILDLPIAESHKIMIIDDDEATIHLFRRYLTGLPYTIIAAQDSKQAVALAEQVRPDLILLDVFLPNVDGWEVLQQLKHNKIVSSTPVIICSAWNEPDIAYSLGADGFLRKNVLQQDLINAIQAALRPGI